jgi:hypothetical protein
VVRDADREQDLVGSWTIRVLKRDGQAEEFDGLKLAAAIWRAMGGGKDAYPQAAYFSEAVRSYLSRCRQGCVSSAAIFEMCVKLLQYVGQPLAARRLQEHRSWRLARRREFRVRHEPGKLTLWEKSWLAEFAQRCWCLSARTSRILAGQVEEDLLRTPAREVPRQEIIDRLNEITAAYGLADAVPVM